MTKRHSRSLLTLARRSFPDEGRDGPRQAALMEGDSVNVLASNDDNDEGGWMSPWRFEDCELFNAFAIRLEQPSCYSIH